MNTTSVAVICVALIAAPAGYAVERLSHERIAAALELNPITAPGTSLNSGRESSYAVSPAWLRPQSRIGDTFFKPGRV